MKLRTQLIAGIVLFAVLLAIVSSFVILTNQQVERLTVQEETANNIALEVGELGYLSNDYILYREPQQADRWNAKFAVISGDIANLSVDQPDQQAIADNLAANLKNTKSVFDDIASSPIQPSGTDPSFIQLSWSRMAVQNQNMIFEAGRLANLMNSESEGLKQARSYFIFTLMGAFAALLLTGYFFFYRRTLRSLGSIQDGADIVGSGNFSHIIDESSRDEIGDLARSFNRMTASLRNVTATKRELESEVAERRRAEADLAEKNEELGALNEELTNAHDEMVHANAQLAGRERDLVTKNEELNALNEEITSAHEELQQSLDELTHSQGALRTSEERLRTLYSSMTEGLAIHEIVTDGTGKATDYRLMEVNPAFTAITGIPRERAVGVLASALYGTGEPPYFNIYSRVAVTGKPEEFETTFVPMEKSFHISVFSPSQGTFATVFSDITDRKRTESNQNMMEEVLRILNLGGDMHRLIGEILGGIRRSAGFDAVALRLRDGEDYPYYEADGFSSDHVKEENSLCARGEDGSFLRHDDGRTVLECTCGVVVSGQADPALRCFTEGGSFWTNKSSDLLDLAPEDDPRTNPRNRCIHTGFQSVALVPVRTSEAIIGLLQLNDRREGRFSPEMIRFFETIASNIGLALERRYAEEALRTSEAREKARSDELALVMEAVPAAVWIAHDPLATHITGNALSDEWLRIPKGSEASKSAPAEVRPESFRLVKDGRELTPSEMPVQLSAAGTEIRNFEFDLAYPDGTVRTVLGNSSPLRDESGNPRGSVSSFIDITERKHDDEILRLTSEVFQISADSSDLPMLLDGYAKLLKRYSGCDSIGVRLLDEKGNIPYHVNIGFSEEFYKRESPLSIGTDQCMCINVIKGTTDPSLPFYTEEGSFYINATTQFLATVSDEDKGQSRNVCNEVGYESVALIPIRKGDEILGLLHLADHREGMVPERMVRIIEEVALAMGSPVLRMKAESSLHETSQYLENLIEYASAPVIVWDPEFRITRFNHAFERLTGIPADSAIGKSLSILFPEDLRQVLMSMIRRTLSGERWEAVEIPVQHINGEVRTVLWNSATLYGADGKTVSSVIAQGQDITDRKKAEETLRETSEYLDSLIMYANAPIIVWDPGFHITRFNHAAEKLTGRTAEEMIGHRLETLFPGESLFDSVRRIKNAALGIRMESVEIPIQHTSGEVRTVLWNSAIILGSDGKSIVSTIAQGQDITERKKAEEALIRAHDELEQRVQERTAKLNQAIEAIGTERHRLYDVLETLPVYVCLLDKDYRMPFSNKYFRDTFGYSDTRCCYDFLFNLPAPCEGCETYTVMKTKAPHHWYWTGPNGKDYDIYDYPFYDTDGSLLILEMGIDITEQNRAEADLRKARDELEVRVRERTAELARRNEDLGSLNEELTATQEELQQNVDELEKSGEILRRNESELKEALEEKEILLSEIHHRVKNNLTAFISLLSLEGSYEDSPEGRNLKKDLQNRARSMALIHETLYRTKKYSSVDMGVYLSTLIEQIAASYISAKSIRTLVDAEGTTIDIARATPCGLIINELITNSFKYAFPESFDCAEVRGEPCTIRVSLKKDDGTYTLRVSDNGAGLPEGLDIKTTQSLGLKLVNFLARHQLRAKIEIVTGNGTEFVFRFSDLTK